MMTFEEWKKSKKDSGTSASSGKSTSGSSNKKILSFEEWKAQKENGFVGNADAQDIPVYALADKNISSPESLNTLYEKPEPVNMPGLQQLYDAAQITYDEYVKSAEYQTYLQKKLAAQGAGLLRDSGVSTSPYAAAQQQPTVKAEDAKEAELRSIRNYYKMLLDAEQDQAVMDADLAKLENWPEEDRKALETYVNFRNNSISSGGYAVPAQEAYKSLVAKYGKVAVANLSESLQRSQNQKNADMLREESAAKVQEKPGAAILHSAATVPANLLGSVASPMGVLGDLASRTGRYQTLDPYNNGNMANVYSSAVRGQVAEDIAGDQYDENGELIKDGGALRQTAAYAYQGLMSAADSLARAAVGGGSKSITLGLAATGSFGQTVSDASARGATPTQAMLLGVATGGLEVLTEHMQLDEILKVAQGGKVTGKQLVKNIFKQAAIEITEEEASFLGSLIAEAVILREKSGYNQQIAEAVANGASYEEAVKMADKSVVMEAVETAIISGFSGGMSATASSAVANANYKTATREIKKEAEGRLKKLGETEDVPEIAKLVAKRVLGEELTAEEKSKLAHSQYGAQVAKEFDPTKSKKYKPVSERMKDQKQAAAETESEAKPEPTDSTDKVEITGEKVEAKKVDAKLGADGKLVWTVEGKETTTDNMQFENADTAYIFEAVEQIENITPTAAPVLIRNVDTSKDVVKQLNGMDEAYTYGYHGYTEAEMQSGDFVSDLTKLQMMEAYRLGQAARNAKVKAQDSRFVRMRTEKDSTTTKRTAETFEANEAQVYFEDGANVVKFDEHRHKYDDKRMAGVNAAKFLSKMGIGGKFYFYESYKKDGKLYYKNADGNEVLAPNGFFKDADGSIHIDINAGNSGNGTTLYTLGHELGHFVKANSEAQFQKLSDLVKESYNKTDMNMHERVLAKQDMLSKVRGEDVSYDEAFEEVVADAMSTMFTDGNIYDQIVELKTTDKNLFDTIKRFFDDLISKFKKVYEKLTPDQKDAQDIREMKDMFDRIQSAFAEALVEASDNFQASLSEKAVESLGENTRSEKQSNRDFTYKELIAKSDIKGRVIKSTQTVKLTSDGSIDKAWVVKQVLNQCESIQTKSSTPTYFVNVPDIGKNVEITGDGIRHSFIKSKAKNGKPVPPRSMINARATLDLPQILRNSIEVNRSDRGDNPEVEFSHVLIGVTALESPSGHIEYYAVRSVVEARKNQGAILTEANIIGKLHAINAKKIGKPHAQVGTSGTVALAHSSLFGYSVADILNDVKSEFDDTFSNDVYKHFGMTRKANGFSKYLKFSDRDSTGNQLSKEQQEYFKDSKVRDEHGRLLAMYHGTPNGGFTKFRSGTYFTQNPVYADVYQNPGASSISAKRSADAPMTYKVYLDIKKPFDTRNARERNIFQQEFYRKYGTGTPLADSGLPDWVDGMDLQEFIEEMEYDYDGLILDEGGVGGYGDEVASRGLSYVVFDPAQVKGVDNKKPTKDPDYRYSVRENATYAEIQEDRQKLYQRERDLTERKRKAENDPDLLQAMDDYSSLFSEMKDLLPKKRAGTATQVELDRIEEIKALREERLQRVADLQESLGLNEMSKEAEEIRTTKEELRIASDEAWAREGAEKENKAIEKAGIPAPEYFRKKALKEFKTTTNFNEAGYLLPDGKMLNFSGGERNHRYRDHREIGQIYEATQGTAALNRFLNDGNIRIMAESPGIDLATGVEPTKEQYAAIKRFVTSHGTKERQFFVDFSDSDGHRAGNYSYTGHVNADRVVNDIKYYFENGKVREQSVVAQFRNSERTDDSVSNRSLLANAFEGLSQNSIEYSMIQEYKQAIKQLNDLDEQLSELNQEIRRLRFGKDVERDSEKLAALEEKASRIAKDINRYDKRLLNMEASEPLRKVLERERKKAAQKTRQRVNEIQQNRKEKATQAELRRKIRKTVRDLDKILNRGNKKVNVKEDMQNVVAKALRAADILFTDNYGTYDMLRNGIGVEMTDSEEALARSCAQMLNDIDKMPSDGYDSWQARQEAESKLRTKMAKLNDVFARERKRLNNTTVSSILGELADAYASLEKSEQSYVQGAYTEAVHNFLKSLQSDVGGTIVKDMTKSQLESVYAAYQMVLNTVRNANKMFNEALKQSREQLGNAVIQEVTTAGGTHGLWTKADIAKNQASWNNTKPIWVANRIGSEAFGKLMDGLFKGQYSFAVDISEAKKFKLEMDKKYHPRNWDTEKLYSFESTTGKKFELNLQQIMSLYAFSKREQAHSHILNGGFVFESNSTVIVDKNGIKKTYLQDGATSYKLDEATLGEIIGTLSAEQKAYVDEMQKYLSDVMGAKGNEVSMELYGIQMFKEKNYFPLRSSGAYMEKAKEAEMKKQQGQINIANSGFTHSVKPEAKNPIILSNFLDVWAEHCNEMSMYHSMVLPMEDFRKVYNYSTIHDEKMDSASVYQTIQDAYGKAATDYIDQLYRELNAGATVDPRETAFKARISKFKKAAVNLSASVVVQQFSAIGRAYALIDPKYFVGAKINSNTSLPAADEMKKYAPVAIIKEMGGFDTGTKGSAKSYIVSEEYGKGERVKGFVKDKQYRGDIMGYAPAKADEITWCAIWEAVKRETKAKHKGMDVKSENFLKLAGERFSEIVERTQVYDSVLARSANMRSKSALMSMATAFMAEPTTTVNLLEDALRGRSVKKIARTFGAVATSILLNNALSAVVYGMRDDDEDETFIEKYFQALTSGVIDDMNPLTYYPFLKDIYSLFQGYDVERADMSVIADLRDALKQAMSVIGKDTSNMDEDELAEYHRKINSTMMSILDAGCSALDIPFKNVRRDVNGIINAYKTIKTDLSGERKTTWNSFWDKVGAAVKDTTPIYAWTKDKSKSDRLYEVYVNGDREYLNRIKSQYEDEDAFNKALRKALRENDSRIHEAAQALYENNASEYSKKFNAILREGNFSSHDIREAIDSELSKINSDSSGETSASTYNTSDFVKSIIVGDNASAKEIRMEYIANKTSAGMTKEDAEKAFQESVNGNVRDSFKAKLLSKKMAQKIMVQYGGKSKEEVDDKLTCWEFQVEYPDVDISDNAILDYYDIAKPLGIKLSSYLTFVNGKKGAKWDQDVATIHKLPLTQKQKDALYLMAGYAESGLGNTPWHR